ncbi:WhiB family transcriptional regulator [Streptomyces sp. SCSIO ZS0520]|uniref:WhiB family transcriptional regulator n=1 Tax=Streptomyces sp. SCSIO ZS0520 TaxID=2892996 RepID=UPI0021D93AAD|nr:WhiB family transcriptional regulator [Streptomyces sp. SCSIO ZS0520]
MKLLRPTAPTTGREEDWRERAACIDQPEAMYPDSDATEIQVAKALCARCPVAAACLAEAMRLEGSRGRDGRFGVWGGLTGPERYLRYHRSARARRAAA